MADNYTCDECGEEFDSERGLHIHIGQVHDQEIEKDTSEKNSEDVEVIGGEHNENDEEGSFPLDAKNIQVPVELAILSIFVLGIAAGLASGLMIAGSGFSLDAPLMDGGDDTNPDTANSVSGDTPREVMLSIADNVGADSDKVASCLDSGDGSEPKEDRRELTSALGKLGTPTFLIGNSEIGFERLRGAQPYSAMKPAIQEQLQEAENGDTNIESDEYTLENVNLEGEPSKGEQGAPIMIVEVSDYACPWCAEWAGYDAIPQRDIDKRDSWNKVKSNHVETGEVEFIYKDFPAHTNSLIAHNAANCVQEQGNDLYWDFHDQLFEHRNKWMAG